MTALIVAALLSQAPINCADGTHHCVSGATAADAPLAVPRPAIEVKAGDLVPFDGTLLDGPLTISTGKRLAAGEASVAATDGKLVIAPSTVVAAVVVVAALVGSAVGLGFAAGKNSK